MIRKEKKSKEDEQPDFVRINAWQNPIKWTLRDRSDKSHILSLALARLINTNKDRFLRHEPPDDFSTIPSPNVSSREYKPLRTIPNLRRIFEALSIYTTFVFFNNTFSNLLRKRDANQSFSVSNDIIRFYFIQDATLYML